MALIIGAAVNGTVSQRRSRADYARTRSAITTEISRFESLLVNGESRTRAAADLHRAGATLASTQGDIVITVVRELNGSSQCRSLAGQLHVSVDARNHVSGWKAPGLDAECD